MKRIQDIMVKRKKRGEGRKHRSDLSRTRCDRGSPLALWWTLITLHGSRVSILFLLVCVCVYLFLIYFCLVLFFFLLPDAYLIKRRPNGWPPRFFSVAHQKKNSPEMSTYIEEKDQKKEKEARKVDPQNDDVY